MFTIAKGFVATSFFISLGAASTGAIAGNATLAETTERTMEVSYADLNLDHPDGQRRLDLRIKRAAEKVCGVQRGRTSLRESVESRACAKDAGKNAMLALTSEGKVRVAARAGR